MYDLEWTILFNGRFYMPRIYWYYTSPAVYLSGYNLIRGNWFIPSWQSVRFVKSSYMGCSHIQCNGLLDLNSD